MKTKKYIGVLFDDFKSNTIQKDVKIGNGTKIEKNVVLKGKTHIGKNCLITCGSVIDNSTIGDETKIVSSHIEDSIVGVGVYIGPYSHLRPESDVGDGCKIGNFVEIKSSKIGKKTKVAHLTYIGNAVVGENVNVGCGVVFVNYDGKNKLSTTVGNNVFIGSNSNLIAPVVVEDGVFIAAGTTVDKNLDANDFCIGRVRQEVKKGYHNKYVENTTLEKTQEREPNKKYFGTDGIRGVYGKDLTDCVCRKCAIALCKFKKNPKIIIGKDTRESGDNLMNVFSSWATKFGAEITSLGVAPTPVVAYMSGLLNADFGVVFTASHNPKEYNGIKVFGKCGRKLSLEDEQSLDCLMQDENDVGDCFASVPVLKNIGLKPYIDFVVAGRKKVLAGKKIVLDMANGASMYTAPNIFKKLGATTKLIGNNAAKGINENCGCMHIDRLSEAVLRNKADMGFAYDGDADRVLSVDCNGKVVDGDQMLFGLFKFYKTKGLLKSNTLVATVQSNLALSKEVEKAGGKMVITPVGDKYVIDEIDNNNYSLGGEQSGHIIIGNLLRTGDGVLASVVLACIVATENRTLAEICHFIPYAQQQKSFTCTNKTEIVNNEFLQEEISKCEKQMDYQGRVLVRPSGTEPKIRLLVECENEKKCLKVFSHLEAILNKLIDNQV